MAERECSCTQEVTGLIETLRGALRTVEGGAKDYRETAASLSVAVERLNGRIEVLTTRIDQLQSAVHSPPCPALTKHTRDWELTSRAEMQQLRQQLTAAQERSSSRWWDVAKLILAAFVGGLLASFRTLIG